MTETEAEQLSILILQIVAKLDHSAAFVQDKDSSTNWTQYRRLASKAMVAAGIDLAEPLWSRFPNLRPVELGGTSVVDPAIHEPRFYAHRA